MSHEIRTPMNAIIGLTQLFGDQIGYAPTRLYEESFTASTGLRIINDILDFSRIEAGKVELENIPFSMGKVVQKVFNLNQLMPARNDLVFRMTNCGQLHR